MELLTAVPSTVKSASWAACVWVHVPPPVEVSDDAAAGVDRIYFYRLLWKHGLRTREPSMRESHWLS